MARIKKDEMEKYNTGGGGNYFKLENDGDFARVQIMCKSPDDLDVFSVHEVKNSKGYSSLIDCPREYDSPIDECPLCESGVKLRSIVVLCLFDHATQEVKIWQRGNQFMKKLDSILNRWPNLEELVVDIERHGAKSDWNTTYEIIPMPSEQPYDLSEIEKPDVSNIVLSKTPDEMRYFIDNGDFPNEDNAQPNEQGTRRAPSRRVAGGNVANAPKRTVSRRVAGN